MYEMPNHRERRKIAKRLGLLKQRKSLPFKAYLSEIQRSIDAGKEIHRQKTELMWRSIEEQESAIAEGRREIDTSSINPKKETIMNILASEGETRSYNEISADIELVAWNKRMHSMPG